MGEGWKGPSTTSYTLGQIKLFPAWQYFEVGYKYLWLWQWESYNGDLYTKCHEFFKLSPELEDHVILSKKCPCICGCIDLFWALVDPWNYTMKLLLLSPDRTEGRIVKGMLFWVENVYIYPLFNLILVFRGF